MKKIERIGIGTHGFTLLEVMMVIAIIAIVVPIGASVLKNNVKFFRNFSSDHVAFQESRMATGIITDQLRGYTRLDNPPTQSFINGYETSIEDSLHQHQTITSSNNPSFDIYFENNLMAKGYGQDVNNGKITTMVKDFSISNGDNNNLISINIDPSTSVPSPLYFELRERHYPTIQDLPLN